MIKEVEEGIRKAKLHNEKNLRKLKDPELKLYVAKLVETENFENALKRKKVLKIFHEIKPTIVCKTCIIRNIVTKFVLKLFT